MAGLQLPTLLNCNLRKAYLIEVKSLYEH